MNRKRVILAALLGVLALSLLYAYFATPRQEKAPPRTESQRARVVAKVAKDTKDQTLESSHARINFDFLSVELQEFSGAQRDIFHFGKKSSPRPESPPVPTASAVVEVPVDPAAPIAPVVPFDVVQKSLGEFTFLGFLEKAGEKTVFLSSGGEIFLVKRGETFGVDHEFRVDSIVGNLLKVHHPGRDSLVEIQLIEQQKLNASASSPARLEPKAAVSGQPDQRIFTPKRKMLRPSPQEIENPFQQIIEENNPEERQEEVAPADEAAPEEEVNDPNR